MHSRFRIPIPTTKTSVSNINMQSTQAQQFRDCSLFIVDETSMVSRNILECVDRLLRDAMQLPDIPFGGKHEFKNWLMEIGDGKSRVYDGNYMVKVPPRVCCP
ncbi:ATP-dependent DNA helicase PIF1-like [Brachionus plicatilis]|uniref:ATP-dependent DNA helicase n=1 Tax=Brachionus plicatilis TaxID=10195 RepID=A0A3M7SUG1_BRAPC|nr:ATP-dependent DNA helicase PIF1-like [Brachionus plicatilis]